MPNRDDVNQAAQSPRITHTNQDGIVTITLNRPNKLNALDMAMFNAIDAHIKHLKKDKTLRAIIINGAGSDFCSGLDIKSVTKSPINFLKLLFKFLPGASNLAQRVSTGWRAIPVPVIAAVHGRCWGGGLQIALGADFRIATPTSDWSILEGKWGLIPDMGGTLALKNLLKQDVAMELAMTAKHLTGSEAHALGLITHLNEDPLQGAMALANQLREHSPDALAGVKKLYLQAGHKSSRWILAKESWYQIKVLLGKNQKVATQRAMAKGEQAKTSYLPRAPW